MDILIKNFSNLARCSFSLDGGIVLVAGHNDAGKTSTLLPLSLALARQPCELSEVRGPDLYSKELHKKDYDSYVKEGEKEGSILIETGDERLTLSWPSGEIMATAKAPLCDVISAGLAKFGKMTPAARKALLIHYLHAAPTQNEVETELRDARWPDKDIESLWAGIQTDGWDGHLAAVKNKDQDAKAVWRHITGEERWGSRKGPTWRPEGWDDDLEKLDQRRLKEDAAQAAEDRDRTQRDIGALEREIVEDKKVIDMLDQNRESLAANKTREIDLSAEISATEDRLAKMPAADGDSGAPCPKCGTQLSPRTEGGFFKLVVFEGGADRETHSKLVKERAKVKDELHNLRKRYSDLGTTIKALGKMIDDGEASKEALAGKEEKLATLKQRGQALMEKSVLLTSRARAIEQLKKAQEQAAIVEDCGKRIEVLDPEGLRRRVLMNRMGDFNARLGKLSAAAGWGTVSVDGHFRCKLENRYYQRLSKSQAFTVDTTIQLAFAQLTKAAAVVIDEADILFQKKRNQLFSLLMAAKVPSVVGMTMNKPDQVPDLQKANIGEAYWMDNGLLQPRAQVLEG